MPLFAEIGCNEMFWLWLIMAAFAVHDLKKKWANLSDGTKETAVRGGTTLVRWWFKL